MDIVRYIGDYHIGHDAVAKKRGFQNAKDMIEYMLFNHNLISCKRSVTYILGDITMEKADYKILKEFKGIKYVCLGNHDRRQDVEELLKYVDGVFGIVKKSDTLITHCPIHPNELTYRCSYNIHGHVHEIPIMDHNNVDVRYLNASAEAVDYMPRTLQELKDISKGIAKLKEEVNVPKEILYKLYFKKYHK